MLRLNVFLIAAAFATSAAAQQVLISERDIARPGGSYATLAIADAGACEALCARDTLCLAWTYRADAMCELKAVIPPPVAVAGAHSGLSARAPEFARAIALPELAAAPAPQELAVAATLTRPDTPTEMALLGGPTEDALRLRLGSAP
jgi:hypothetical protein